MAILNGWQAIAEYLKVSAKTAKRYAKEHGLPVRQEGGAILASERSLTLWVEGEWPEKVEKG